MKPAVGILSLGCSRNLVDSEAVCGRLFSKGYRITDINEAEIGIVNTCAFVNDAKRESIDVILDLIQLKKEGVLKKIIVQGCLVQRYGDELRREFPEVDAFIGRISPGWCNRAESFRLTPKHYAYLKISEGCLSRCTYCVIPAIKGRFTSVPENILLSRAAQLDASGSGEINIVAQDLTAYGRDLGKGVTLSSMLEKLARRCRKAKWLRLLYLYPGAEVERVVELMRREKKFCRYVDLPLQHINARILRLMGRRNGKDYLLRLIDMIRRRLPDAAIRTTFIVGFPSETEREFRELADFIRDARFERLGAFIYSREEGTAAALMPGQVPEKVKRARFDEIMSLQQGISAEINRAMLGRELEVLVEEEASLPPGNALSAASYVYAGRSCYDAPEVDGMVYVKTRTPLKPGSMVRVRVDGALEYDLTGDVLL